MRLGMTIFAATVASLGTVAFAAHQVVMASESLSFQPGFGFSVSAVDADGAGPGRTRRRRAPNEAPSCPRNWLSSS